MNLVWMFLEGEGERFKGIRKGSYPSKPLIFNSSKLREFGGGGRGREWFHLF
jgi:hypothetical protein